MNGVSESEAVRTMAAGGAAAALGHDPEAESRRARLVPELANMIEQGARPRSSSARRKRFSLFAAAAAVFFVVCGGWMARSMIGGPGAVMGARLESVLGPVKVEASGREWLAAPTFATEAAPTFATETATEALSPRAKVTTADSAQATIRMASGTQVLVGPSATVQMSAIAPFADGYAMEEVGLSRGRVDVIVPKLPVGALFEVVTAHARVRVHGTRFSVEIDEHGDEPTTKVVVTEGLVSVHHEAGVAMLGAGGTWISAARVAEPASAPLPESPPETDGGSAFGAAQTGAEPGAVTERKWVREPKPRRVSPVEQREDPAPAEEIAPPPRSTLAAENRLFQSAMRLARSGDAAAALRTLDRFLSLYPESPLARNARAERARVLARSERVEGTD
jgi:ferric-dicitrate binding protein FerR (iron transport regulator)